jgi:hypothetical protein
MDTILTRQERENLVLDLYFNQNKNTREISQEAKMSFREIGTILDKARREKEATKEQTEKQSLSTQAYKLFSEGKTPTEVAIALNIRQPEVAEFQNEYWKLNQVYSLSQIYQETGDNLYSFLELYRRTKVAGMNIDNIINLLRIANNDIPSVEHRCEELRREAAFLSAGNLTAAKASKQLSNEILEKHGTLDRFRLSCNEERLELAKLHKQKVDLEYTIKQFQNNNEEYLKIKETIKQEIEHVLGYRRQLLKEALLSVIDACLNDPVKFKILFYNMPPIINTTSTTTATETPSALSGQSNLSNHELSMDLQSQYPYTNNNDIYEKSLLDEAERFYNKRVEKLTQHCIDQISSDNSISPSTSLQSPANSYSYSKEVLSAHTYVEEEEYTATQTEINTKFKQTELGS